MAEDWNQWRGPRRDGVISGLTVPEKWPAKLSRAWKVEVGEGHSSPLIVGENAYIFTRIGENEVMRCLEASSGKIFWRDDYPAPYTMNPAAQGHGKGPKSTPLLAEGRLYTLGISGILTCRDIRNGRPRWQHHFAGEYKQTSPLYGAAMSPLVEGGLLIVHVGGHDSGGLTAFDARNGPVRWRWTEDGPAYSSPVVATIGGVRQIITQTQSRCVGVELQTGKLLWSLPFKTSYDQNSISPVVAEDRVIFAGMQKPTFACRITRSGSGWSAVKLWETTDVTMYMSSPVAVNGRLYGLSEKQSGQMFCLDIASGKVLWRGEGRMGENASVWDVGSYLLALTVGAELIVYRKGDALSEVARYTVADSATWASPAFYGNHILVKDRNSLTLWTL